MKIINGDSLEVLKSMESDSLEALVTDPPYGLSKMTTENIQECLTNWLSGEKYTHKEKGFMNKAWDSFVPSPDLWREVFRVLKPGAHGLVFAGSRTQDLMSISLRLAGFEIRDTLMWVYGSGFPKSHNISKAIDKKLGAEREVVGFRLSQGGRSQCTNSVGQHLIDYGKKIPITEPATEEAKHWEGWGTALKPAYEPILLIRKPLKGTVAQNVLEHGCGGINIDATRVGNTGATRKINPEKYRYQGIALSEGLNGGQKEKLNVGRFPANVMIDEHIEHEAMQRYFYCTKAGKKEREAGCEQLTKKTNTELTGRKEGSAGLVRIKNGKPDANPYAGTSGQQPRANTHPTVKPLDLMRYLVKMVVPPSGTALDPFCGSGSTLCALALENMNGIGIELQEEYCEIAQARVKHWGGEAERVEQPNKELEELPLFKGLL